MKFLREYLSFKVALNLLATGVHKYMVYSENTVIAYAYTGKKMRRYRKGVRESLVAISSFDYDREAWHITDKL